MRMYIFRLYVAGESLNSARALTNLKALCAQYLSGSHRIEIVDVLKKPQQALAAGVIVTPTLVKVAPLPSQQVIGDLGAQSQVLLVLGLQERTA